MLKKTITIPSILSSFSLSAAPQLGLGEKINEWFEPMVVLLAKILFFDPVKTLGIDVGVAVPLVVVWLIVGGLTFTIWFRFINIRAFKYAIDLVRGKYDKEEDKGEVSHFQALATALSGTVGLGNIASVAIAIAIGGPGATFWMIVAGFLGMSSKFVECTLGVKYRVIDENGEVSGGPMYYLSEGLRQKGLPRLGKILAVLFAILIVGASLGGGNMFQANQACAQFFMLFPQWKSEGLMFGLIIAIFIGVVIVGGIRSIAQVTEKIVPFMAALYILTALVIIGMNISQLGEVFMLIIKSAFGVNALKGGFIGVLIVGFQRGAFSNEAGIGSASIAHSASKTSEPISEGIVSLLEPFVDTVVICTMTALVIIFTGVYTNPGNLEGSQLTSYAFGTVFPWFPYVLVVAIFLFAFSTMISWSYYGLKGFNYLFQDFFEKKFKNKLFSNYIYYTLFLVCVVVGSVSSLGTVTDFADMMILSMAFPNILGLIILAPEVKKDLNSYMKRLKSGKIKASK